MKRASKKKTPLYGFKYLPMSITDPAGMPVEAPSVHRQGIQTGLELSLTNGQPYHLVMHPRLKFRAVREQGAWFAISVEGPTVVSQYRARMTNTI